MEDMWKTRQAPTPLKYGDILSQVDDLPSDMDTTPLEGSTLKDQRVWTLQETVQVFTDRYTMRLIVIVLRLEETNEGSLRGGFFFSLCAFFES